MLTCLFRRLLTRDVRDVKRLYLSGERPLKLLVCFFLWEIKDVLRESSQV